MLVQRDDDQAVEIAADTVGKVTVGYWGQRALHWPVVNAVQSENRMTEKGIEERHV